MTRKHCLHAIDRVSIQILWRERKSRYRGCTLPYLSKKIAESHEANMANIRKMTTAVRIFLAILLWQYPLITFAQYRKISPEKSISDHDQIISLRNENYFLLKEKDEFLREKYVIEAKSELQDSSNSRLEILVGLFGLLLTILVIAFGFRTEKAAAKAAKAEIADQKAELDRIISEARKAAEAAQSALATAEAASLRADDHASSAAAQVTEVSLQIATIKAASEVMSNKKVADIEELSDDEAESSRSILTEIFEMYEKEDWVNLIRIADILGDRKDISEDDSANILYFKAVAYDRIGFKQGKVELYSNIIDRYINSSDVKVRRTVALVMIGRGLTCSVLDQDALETESYNLAIKTFSSDDDPEIRKNVANAYFWKAANDARDGKIKLPIEYLKKWAEFGKFNCAEIYDSPYFKNSLKSSVFRKFMIDMGCSYSEHIMLD